MSAEMPRRRSISATEAAKRLGTSARTIQRVVAESRAEYETRQRDRGDQVLQWRAEGLLWREIAERLGISLNAAQKAGEYAKKRRVREERARRDAETLPPPLFP